MFITVCICYLRFVYEINTIFFHMAIYGKARIRKFKKPYLLNSERQLYHFLFFFLDLSFTYK